MTQTKEYHKDWRKKNPEKSKAIKQKYEIKRKEQRKIAREEKENNKYF